jgi:hypothetical protein
MEKLIEAMAPVFAAGLGIQQLGEILDPILERVSADRKRVVMGVVSLSIGLAVAFIGKLHVLAILGAPDDKIINPLITGLIISGGTEGINSILKFLKYTKEDKKNEAAAKAPAAPGTPVTPGVPAPAPPASAALAPSAGAGVPVVSGNGAPVARASAPAVQDINRK